MKRVFLIFPLILIILGCSSDDDIQQNPYLPHLNFSVTFDLSLPEYNALNFPGNKYINRNYGLNGIVVYNLNNDQYMAFELSDPNHVLQACSSLDVIGTEAICSCGDGNRFTIITGQPLTDNISYSLKPYRVEKVGNVLRISG